jgi:phosphomannomutase
MDRSIFRAYDIRGVYPAELNEQTAYLLGRAVFEYLGGVKKAAVCRDARIAGPAIQTAFMSGLADCGVEVTDIGVMSSDVRAFATGALGYDLGVSITASHNPAEWIGMKMAKAGGVEVGGTGETLEIGEIAMRLEAEGIMYDEKIERKFGFRDITEEWISHVLSFDNSGGIKPMRIVVDAGNGVGGLMMEALVKKLPLEIIPMYFEPDGNFPNHLPSPIEPENTETLRARVVEEKADMGMAFDGDADRVYLVDENGRIVTGSEMTAMLIDALLSKDPGKVVLYNAICGWNVRDVLAKYPGVVSHRTKVGHGYIKKDMVRYGADFAGEHSGHYFFKDNFNADSGLATVVVALGLISDKSQKLSDILEEYRKYVQIPETNFVVSDVARAIEVIAQKYSDGETDRFDGITVGYPEYWFNIRPSSTEPVLRLNLEAVNQQVLQDKLVELTELIKKLS